MVQFNATAALPSSMEGVFGADTAGLFADEEGAANHGHQEGVHFSTGTTSTTFRPEFGTVSFEACHIGEGGGGGGASGSAGAGAGAGAGGGGGEDGGGGGGIGTGTCRMAIVLTRGYSFAGDTGDTRGCTTPGTRRDVLSLGFGHRDTDPAFITSSVRCVLDEKYDTLGQKSSPTCFIFDLSSTHKISFSVTRTSVAYLGGINQATGCFVVFAARVAETVHISNVGTRSTKTEFHTVALTYDQPRVVPMKTFSLNPSGAFSVPEGLHDPGFGPGFLVRETTTPLPLQLTRDRFFSIRSLLHETEGTATYAGLVAVTSGEPVTALTHPAEISSPYHDSHIRLDNSGTMLPRAMHHPTGLKWKVGYFDSGPCTWVSTDLVAPSAV